MTNQSSAESAEGKTTEAGIFKLGSLIWAAKLPQALQFLDATDLSAADRAALTRAIDHIHPTALRDVRRAVRAFTASKSSSEVQALADLGNRIVPSHSQFLATTAWSNVFKRLQQAPPALGLVGLDNEIADYLRFEADIGLRAIEADFAAELDPSERTHAFLATAAVWQRLRKLLRLIETRLGDRREAFLAWARSIESQRADVLMLVADLEKSS